MIVFPNAKINLGLRILRKRPDGYHDLESVFVPAPWFDTLEIIPSNKDSFLQTGNALDAGPGNNLVEKARDLLRQEFAVPPVDIHLHKNIPSGAGLGGGSSDAAFTLKLLCSLFKLSCDENALLEMAGRLGSDCPFFIRNTSAFVTGTGHHVEEIPNAVLLYYILMIFPGEGMPTAEAYRLVKPMENFENVSLKEVFAGNPANWKRDLQNDFEEGVFEKIPQLGNLKKNLADLGAFYTGMSVSGSTIFGLFEHLPYVNPGDFNGHICLGRMNQTGPILFE